MQTVGQYRVGVSFNPSNNAEVDSVKDITANLISFLHNIVTTKGGTEAARCAALAMTAYEEACMWAVKSITKPDRE
jgi:hypothetical protein